MVGRMLQRNTGAAGRAAQAARHPDLEQPRCQPDPTKNEPFSEEFRQL
jgi:hypothetical protein